MISIKLLGRLGNQLFQYAFIFSASKKLSTSFYLDKSIEPFLLSRFFVLPKDQVYIADKYIFSINGFKNIFSYHLKKQFYKLLKALYRLETISFSNSISPKEELNRLQNGALYEGYFQSETYFKEYSSSIKGLFKIKTKYIDLYSETSAFLPKGMKTVAIHIRKGDYVDLGLNLPMNYYHLAISKVNQPENFYIFLSDEPDSIAREFDYLNNKYISYNEEIIDFQFLVNADVCIISNSSFSWWGAYLNENKRAVIAPKFWLGIGNTENPVSIIPSDWISLEHA